MSMTYESFADCFPTIAENAGDALRALHGDMVVKLGVLARVSDGLRYPFSSYEVEAKRAWGGEDRELDDRGIRAWLTETNPERVRQNPPRTYCYNPSQRPRRPHC
jgi:hypothetical protein